MSEQGLWHSERMPERHDNGAKPFLRQPEVSQIVDSPAHHVTRGLQHAAAIGEVRPMPLREEVRDILNEDGIRPKRHREATEVDKEAPSGISPLDSLSMGSETLARGATDENSAIVVGPTPSIQEAR